jgi:hypothetical protein
VASNVAANCTNTLQCKRLWMCRLSFAGLPEQLKPDDPDKSKEDDETWFDKFMNGMKVEPLKGAFLVIVPVSSGQSMVPPGASCPIYCRTGDDGEILRIADSEVEGCAPRSDASHWMLFSGDAYYLYFWTLSKELFKTVIGEARADIGNVTSNYEFGSFQVSYQDRPLPFRDRDSPWELFQDVSAWAAIDLLKPNLFLRTSKSFSAGIYEGHRVLYNSRHSCKKPQPCHIDYTHDYVFARSDVIDALYLSELVHYHAISLRQKTIKDFAVFKQVQDICELASSRESVPTFDVEAPQQAYYRKIYVDYAFDCAQQPKEMISHKLFSEAITVLVNQKGWIEAAQQIAQLGIAHPCSDGDGDLSEWVNHFKITYTPPVMHYFDFYRFGKEQAEQDWNARVAATEEKIEKALSQVRDHLCAFMHSRLNYTDLIIALGTHCHPDPCVRTGLHTRYLEHALNVHYRWWEHLYMGDEEKWSKVKKYTDWLGELLHKGGELFKHHFGTLETIERYNEMLEENVEAIKEMFAELGKLNKRLGGRTVRRKIKKLNLEANFAAGTVVVTDGASEIGTFHFFTEVGSKTKEVPPRRPRSRRFKKRWKKIQVKTRSYHVDEPPLKEFKEWPEWLESIGAFITLAMSVAEFVETFKEEEEKTTGEKIEVAARLGQNTCLFLDSFSEALNSTFKYAGKEFGVLSKFEEFGAKLKGPGLVLEAALNVKDGSTILLLGEDSLSAKAVVDGDEFEGWLQESKGLILVASAVPGAVAAGSTLVLGGTAAAAFSAALPPLGVALAIASILVVGIEIAIYLHRGPSNVMEPIEEALERALKKEFGAVKDSHGHEYKKERTYESISRFSCYSTGLLS